MQRSPEQPREPGPLAAPPELPPRVSEDFEHRRAAAKELALISSRLVSGRPGSVGNQLGDYVLHREMGQELVDLFLSLTRQTSAFRHELDRLLPMVLGISPGDYKRLKQEISEQHDKP